MQQYGKSNVTKENDETKSIGEKHIFTETLARDVKRNVTKEIYETNIIEEKHMFEETPTRDAKGVGDQQRLWQGKPSSPELSQED